MKTTLILTARKKQILRLAYKGWTYKQMASYLGISVHAVGDHLGQIREMLGVKGQPKDLCMSAIANLCQQLQNQPEGGLVVETPNQPAAPPAHYAPPRPRPLGELTGLFDLDPANLQSESGDPAFTYSDPAFYDY